MNAEAAAWLVATGCPSRYAEVVTGDGLCETPALAELRGAFAAGMDFAVLAGAIGVGKSVAAAAWLLERRAACAAALSAAPSGAVAPSEIPASRGAWLHAHQLAALASFDGRAELSRVEAVPWLVLDDLGVEPLDSKGWLAAALDGLVYQRHGNRRPTVITSNLPAADFLRRYGPRVASRLAECAAVVELSGRDLRRPAEARNGA